ncbi:MAG: bifunctional proline dehydrogenase/L-glutamate gamma-semialdehyde dehydrogenase [Desulfatiglans sp.]|jgi:RHH-type proline utilization regulon transcriptional repressor/proline dehydrogenase/delta 1-pyrroline-5-carboxylate dehydrogenase|nr:bifunctional proline dehydrogenase/L-glutamate gamma-semialdehyde dehydrogenase [Desulfatiglans sp.]
MDTKQMEDLAQKAIHRAEKWQKRANELMTREEKGIQEQMQRLLTRPIDMVVLTRLIDQGFRSHSPARIADQLNSILKDYGTPEFFSRFEKILVQMFMDFGRHLPRLSVPQFIEKIREGSSRALIPGERESLSAYLRKRKTEGVRVNINHLGEAVLGEKEALRRLDKYIEDLKNPEIEYISVKISTIYSQINPLAFGRTVEVLTDRLARLFQAAATHYFRHPDGHETAKFVNLDMEEYRDLGITCESFTRALDRSELKACFAGIALQAYLPDSYIIQKQLTDWAVKRVADGGSPVKIRIVKGANMEMEKIESALFDWPLAPYDNKHDVDANYKRMIHFGMAPENLRAVHLGIASHNLFELAYAYELARENRWGEHVSFEMLEGMADHVRRAVSEDDSEIILYAPVVTKDHFINAIAYLIRRLDENTSEENFLRYAPFLEVDSKPWKMLVYRFLESCRHIDRVGTLPHRVQDRNSEIFPKQTGTLSTGEFRNEPNTDWSLPANQKWAESIRTNWKKDFSDDPDEIPLVIAGQEIFSNNEIVDCLDPSQWIEKVSVARYRLAGESDIEKAVAVAKKDPDAWRSQPLQTRLETLSQVAVRLRQMRGDLIGAAAANTGKIFTEADVEVSEAIDFAEYYPLSTTLFNDLKQIESSGKGVGMVISPWNFPIAIPCGGLIGSLASGNTVIFKPASDAVLVAWLLCRAFWEAGISKNTLQFCPCTGAGAGEALACHEDIDFVILTGGTETGLRLLARRPDLPLMAETGGKNAVIVTDMADRDQAIKNIVYSAFGNTGQKCSATSLLILEKEVYQDKHFKQQLVDAAESLSVGSAWDFNNRVGPLIRPPAGALKQALTTLETGESWALKPRNLSDNPHIWTPGIKWDVQPGSRTHMVEFFGPLLGVMCADDLDQAVQLANGTGYGLTSGIESLDKREQEQWKKTIRAGNLYINRGTTGAVTLRQPFGGLGKSALGPGIKTGSPDYVSQFMWFEETGFPRIGAIDSDHVLLTLAGKWQNDLHWGRFSGIAEDITKTVRAIKSYLFQFEQRFSRKIDYFHLPGQDNILRFLPIEKMVIRLNERDSLFETLARIAAARICGCTTRISIPVDLKNDVVDFVRSDVSRPLVGDSKIVFQADTELVEDIGDVQGIRYAGPDRVPEPILHAAAQTGFYVARDQVLMEGRIELLKYLKSQSICDMYHRYGNLGERAPSL